MQLHQVLRTARLRTQQERDRSLWERHVDYLAKFAAGSRNAEDIEFMGINERRDHARAELARVSTPEYLAALTGTVGADAM